MTKIKILDDDLLDALKDAEQHLDEYFFNLVGRTEPANSVIGWCPSELREEGMENHRSAWFHLQSAKKLIARLEAVE